ncbi:MAG TPA: hypothetical protein PKC59_06765 [Burkholderiaceae bacterium]|nr:hypothetical protein [Burkholderiaceae bacterium]HMX09491.1 hypothetical protein [Burkholderiaceae bacterium]HMZ02240.1 hypothetical protein [Burkholderiaceae bacterium]HNB42994.1 hypothetical protein [Burkholderiaceae bacterium]HNG77854.1 hypothetical protein [Burkholderiaceae bacterium]
MDNGVRSSRKLGNRCAFGHAIETPSFLGLPASGRSSNAGCEDVAHMLRQRREIHRNSKQLGST